MASGLERRLMNYPCINTRRIGSEMPFKISLHLERFIAYQDGEDSSEPMDAHIGLSYDLATDSQPWMLVIEYVIKSQKHTETADEYCFKINPDGRVGVCYKNDVFVESSVAEYILSSFESGVLEWQASRS